MDDRILIVAQFKFQWEHVIGKSILNVRNPFQATVRFLFTLKTGNVDVFRRNKIEHRLEIS